MLSPRQELREEHSMNAGYSVGDLWTASPCKIKEMENCFRKKSGLLIVSANAALALCWHDTV
jgi:hypothetical protein